MPSSIYEATIPVFDQFLSSLSKLIDKAAAYAGERKIDPAVLLASRLRPDMFPLVRQVQTVCDWAKNVAARLAGVEPPKFEDHEASFEDLKARIAKTLDYVRSLDRHDVEAGAERLVVFPMGPNKMKMTGADYAFHLGLPNFYFHMTTAYGILRHNGLEIGKRDFMGAVPGISPA